MLRVLHYGYCVRVLGYILKFAAYRKTRRVPQLQPIRWGALERWVKVFTRTEIDTRQEIRDESLRREVGTSPSSPMQANRAAPDFS
jgi:hypothetical protein